jgi:ATP-dependent RNA helicase SUPV3L1/SUV3
VAPNWWHVSTIAQRLGKQRLQEVLNVFMDQLRLDNAHFQVAELEQMLDLAGELDRNAASLSLRDRFVYAQAPVDARTETLVQDFLGWAWEHAQKGSVSRPGVLDEVDEHSRLDRMEQALRTCTLWLWLDLRFPGIYGQVDEVVGLRSRLNDGIERQLKGKKPLWQMRQRGAPGADRRDSDRLEFAGGDLEDDACDRWPGDPLRPEWGWGCLRCQPDTRCRAHDRRPAAVPFDLATLKTNWKRRIR